MDQKTFCLGKARENVLKLLERYSRNGVVLSGGEREDIGKRFLALLNHHIRRIYTELYRGEKTAAVFLSDGGGEKLLPPDTLSDGEQRTAGFSGSGAAVVLSVSGCGTLTVQNGGEERTVSFASHPGLFRDVKLYVGDCFDALLTLHADGNVKVRGAVLYTGIHREDEEPESADGLPDFPEKGVLTAALPEDFLFLCGVRREGGQREEELCDFSVNGGFLRSKKAKCGEYILTYRNMPEELCDKDGDFAAVPLPLRYFDLLCLVTARDLCNDEQSDVYAKLGIRAAEAEAALAVSEEPYRRDKAPYYRDAFRKGGSLRRHFFG